MRGTSWNVNGLYRKLADADFLEYISHFHLLLFNETWLSSKDQSNLEIDEYKSVHIFANKSPGVRKGRLSGGISLYSRQCYADKIKVVEQHQNGILWIKIQNDLFHHDQDVFLCHVYIPPANSKLRKNDEFDIFETTEQGIIKYKVDGKNFLTGDWNSRTSNLSDLLDYDKFLDDEQTFSNYFGLQLNPRVNSDHVVAGVDCYCYAKCQI